MIISATVTTPEVTNALSHTHLADVRLSLILLTDGLTWGNPRECHTHGFQVPTELAHGRSNVVVVNSVASRWIKASTNKTSNL